MWTIQQTHAKYDRLDEETASLTQHRDLSDGPFSQTIY